MIVNNTTDIGTDLADGNAASSTVVDVVLKVIFGVIGSLGIIGNFLVCFIIIHVRSLLNSNTNLLILNQSAIDMVSAIAFVVLYLGPTIKLPLNVLGDFICRIWASEYVLWAMFVASTFNLVALTLDRFFAIVHPIKHHNGFSKVKIKAMICCIWVSAFVYETYWAVAHFNDNGKCSIYWYHVAFQRFSGVMVFLVQYLIPLSIMSFAYISIFLALKRRPGAMSSEEGSANNARNVLSVGQVDVARSNSEESKNVRARKNVIKTLFIVSLSYAICWTPNAFVFLNYNLGGYLDFKSPLYYITVVSVNCNMCVNPFIYAMKYQQFRRALRKTFCGRHFENKVNEGTASGSVNSRAAQNTANTSVDASTQDVI
ncbi:allatostatin-A receptor-like [Ptychodera flava]|uniref:allatostatin-A receptor-like n=1 Tax=Ptychodera flava TaxID=63121 RepID=UPI00396A01FC